MNTLVSTTIMFALVACSEPIDPGNGFDDAQSFDTLDAQPVDAQPVEQCFSGLDDDGDGFIDCDDTDCFDLDVCLGTCANPIVIESDSTTICSTIDDFTSLSCEKTWSGHDRVYAFISPNTNIEVRLENRDGGIYGLEIRTECSDRRTAVVCHSGALLLTNDCDIDSVTPYPPMVTFAIIPNTVYYIIVSGIQDCWSVGSCKLTLSD